MIRGLFDLIIEGLHLLLLYGFLCICAIGVIIIVVSHADNNTPQSNEYVTYADKSIRHKDSTEGDLRIPKRTSERTCNRIAGCKVFPDAPTLEEYCPACIWKEM